MLLGRPELTGPAALKGCASLTDRRGLGAGLRRGLTGSKVLAGQVSTAMALRGPEARVG